MSLHIHATSVAAPMADAAAQAPWRVRLLGAVEAHGPGGQQLSHWPLRATAVLLARLALEPDREHPREELIELLWPGVSLPVGRNRLRQTLFALNRLLQPGGGPQPPVLLATRLAVRVRPGALDCDARRFEALARAGDAAAQALYRGELMPGHYDDWVLDLRRHLAERHERLAAAAPALPAPPLATGLPGYWTRPFGMAPAASRLRALVATQRLVTVHGPGGSGKTRLAAAVAQALQDDPAGSVDALPAPRFDRIHFVALVDCVQPAALLDALGDALQADAALATRQRLMAALAQRRSLLVLDNLEQLAPEAVAELGALLAALPGLHVLATSRRLLQLDGEWAFGLDGLALPGPEAEVDEAAANPAVALFVDRARACRAEFRLTRQDATAVVGLVRLLAGMPLAIELAASRMRGLGPGELLQRLKHDAGTPALDLLTRPQQHADASARHASLRHMVGWSWAQLTPAAQGLLRTQSVLAGAAPSDAVAAVAGVSRPEAETLLDQLRDASMLQSAQDATGNWRHALLQPVREFAGERCSPAQASAARARLRQWLMAQATEAGTSQASLAAERVHLHTALLHADADGAPEQALALAVATRGLWAWQPPAPTVLQALAVCAQQARTAPCWPEAAMVLAQGWLAAGDTQAALHWAEQGLLAARSHSQHSQALTVWARCRYACGQFDTDFDTALAQAVQHAEQAGDDAALAMALTMQGLVACNFRLDYAAAERLATRTQALWERLGDARQALLALQNRATMWAWQGRNDEAAVVLAETEAAARAQANWTGLVGIARQLGRVHVRRRCWDEAEAAFHRSLQVARQHHLAHGVLHALLQLPTTLACGPQAALAARLQGFATTEWARRYGALNRIEQREMQRTWRLLRLRLGAARAEALRSLGATLRLDEAVALALALH